ncbi:replication protein A 32 kDa subunit A-like [Pistacia vera]|uniref:replication protein A 32 kDa subunit A-like n=1 Tax=Pistacia vera TaxID=55513 RepID=UPI001262EDB9|nr:replication protein A 32 kDa subunit A-like [Pistacia vera]
MQAIAIDGRKRPKRRPSLAVSDAKDMLWFSVNDGQIRGDLTGKGQIGEIPTIMVGRPVTSFDEVTFHFIDCIYFQSQKSKSQQQGLSINQPQMVDSSLHTPVRTGTKGYQTAPSNNLSSQFGIDGLKDCDQLILDYLQQPSSSERERGVHIAELSQHLKIPEKKIMDSIVSLENEGLIYSTIDEFHYKFARG